MAKSPWRRLNSMKPQRQLSSRSGRRTSTIISSPARSVVKIVLKKSPAGIVRLAPAFRATIVGIEGEGERAPFGGGVGMGEAAGEGAADADRQVRDVVGDCGKEPGERAGGDRLLEGDMAGEGADGELAVGRAHARKRRDAVDVDEDRGPGEAEGHRRNEALAAGKHAAVGSVAREKVEGFLERFAARDSRRTRASSRERLALPRVWFKTIQCRSKPPRSRKVEIDPERPGASSRCSSRCGGCARSCRRSGRRSSACA